LLLFCFAASLKAQEPQDVVRISTNLVQVDVVVTKDGKQVTDLKAEDFEIREDGRLQQITNFIYVSVKPGANSPVAKAAISPTADTSKAASTQPPQPHDVKRTLAIVVDDLGMSFQSIANLRTYLRKFIAESLGPNDLVAIIRTGGEVGALQQFTTDARVLSSAIADLKWNPCSRVGPRVLSPERSLITVMPPQSEPSMRGRVPTSVSPTSNQVDRPTTANESNACSVGNSVNYSISAIRFILRGMQDLPGRKSMMLISDNLPMARQEGAPANFGFKRPVRDPDANLIDVWTQSTSYTEGLHGLVDQAIRSSVVIYGIPSQGLQATGVQAADEILTPPQHLIRGPGPRPEPEQLSKLINARSLELKRNVDGAEVLAKETGGFLIRNRNDFGLDRVLEDQSGYYLIGYRPATETFDRKYHTIQARVKHSGYVVRTRGGFFGVTDNAPASGASALDRLNKALVSPFAAKDIQVRLTALFANDPKRGSMLRSFFVIDAKDLTFGNDGNGAHVANFDLSTALFSDNGAVLDRQVFKVKLSLDEDVFQRAQREGVLYGLDLPLKHPGAFQLRVAIRDEASEHIGAAAQFVQTPNLSNGQLALSGIVLYADSLKAQPGTDDEWRRSVVHRRFHQGAALVFGYTIYNAAIDKKTHLPLLTAQTFVFRDGERIYNTERLPVEAIGQTDLQRIATGARLQLGPALTPGEYVVQIVVEDQVGKRTTTQVAQFEVFK
jgi:VWFA-related protein